MHHIISVDELAQRIGSGHKQTLLATLWYKDGLDGQTQFNSEHIPTSLYCDPSQALAGVPSSAAGRNPMPDVETLTYWMQRWGITADRDVVVYGNTRGLFSSRAWWMLRWAGVDNVRILDGGLREWERKGGQTLGGPGNFASITDIEVRPNSMPTATMEDVRNHTGLLLDAREPNRFSGLKEYLDLRAGHIPNAVNIPTRAVLTERDLFLKPEELRTVFTAAGITESNIEDAIIYSGSGNHSAQVIAALELAGFPAPRHYVGGWSQWSANKENPVETS